MSVSSRIRDVIVDSPSSFGERARARRWDQMTALFPLLSEMSVVDLGGTVEAWMRAPVRPRHVTVLNLLEPGTSTVDWITPVTGDACFAQQTLEGAGAAGPFDMVFSNAVLEHVGGYSQRMRFAESTRSLAPRHWVQTPYRYFPVEPHWLFPGMQFLPLAARTQVARYWPLANTPSDSLEDARQSVLWTELIGLTEMTDLFPDSTIVRERVGGLTKSIIAVQV